MAPTISLDRNRLQRADVRGLWLAALVGIVVTAGAIYGAIYKVTAPTSYAPYAALAVFVAGIVVAFARVGKNDAPASVASKAAAEAGR